MYYKDLINLSGISELILCLQVGGKDIRLPASASKGCNAALFASTSLSIKMPMLKISSIVLKLLGSKNATRGIAILRLN